MVEIAARQLPRRSARHVDDEQMAAALLPADSVEAGRESPRIRGAFRSWALAFARSGTPTRHTTTIFVESGDHASWLTGPGRSPSRAGTPPSSGASRTWASSGSLSPTEM